MPTRMNVKLDSGAFEKLKRHVDAWNETRESQLGSSRGKLTLGEALGKAIECFVSRPELLLRNEVAHLEAELIAKQQEVTLKFEKLRAGLQFRSEDGSITLEPWGSRVHKSKKRRKK